MRQEKMRDGTKCYVIDRITKCVVESFTGMRKAERGKRLRKSWWSVVEHITCEVALRQTDGDVQLVVGKYEKHSHLPGTGEGFGKGSEAVLTGWTMALQTGYQGCTKPSRQNLIREEQAIRYGEGWEAKIWRLPYVAFSHNPWDWLWTDHFHWWGTTYVTVYSMTLWLICTLKSGFLSSLMFL